MSANSLRTFKLSNLISPQTAYCGLGVGFAVLGGLPVIEGGFAVLESGGFTAAFAAAFAAPLGFGAGVVAGFTGDGPAGNGVPIKAGVPGFAGGASPEIDAVCQI